VTTEAPPVEQKPTLAPPKKSDAADEKPELDSSSQQPSSGAVEESTKSTTETGGPSLTAPETGSKTGPYPTLKDQDQDI